MRDVSILGATPGKTGRKATLLTVLAVTFAVTMALLLATTVCLAGIRWTAGGVLVSLTYHPTDSNNPQITSDGSGGAIITWEDGLYGQMHPGIYAKRIDADGGRHTGWPLGGVTICESGDYIGKLPKITSDGDHGAIITWVDDRNGNNDIYAQRVGANGNTKWTDNGVPICTAGGESVNKYPQIISDGDHGAIRTWTENRYGHPGKQQVYAQRVDKNGITKWTPGGVSVTPVDPPIEGDQTGPQITSDGLGGAIITWEDNRDGNNDIYVQRVNVFGSTRWADRGVLICTDTHSQENPQIISDGSNGAIITWEDLRSGNYDIYAQLVNVFGSVQWTSGGKAVCTATGYQINPQITSDGSHGAIITWGDNRNSATTGLDIYAQSVDVNGIPGWTANGVAICRATGEDYFPQMTSDGSGGAIITWENWSSSTENRFDIYAQRVLFGGTVDWQANGIHIGTTNWIDEPNPQKPWITSDGAGGAIITWEYSTLTIGGVFAQRVSRDAPTVTSIDPSDGDNNNSVHINNLAGTDFFATTTTDPTVALYDPVNHDTITATNVNVVSANQITCDFDIRQAAVGQRNVVVTNPDGQSYTLAGAFTVGYPVPTTTGISPTSKIAGQVAFTLTVNGTDFVNGLSKVRWNGTNRITNYVSDTQLKASIPALDIISVGTADVTVYTPSPGGGTSNPQTFTINPVPEPTTTSLSPDSKIAGDTSFTLTVNGTNFVSSLSKITWNGEDCNTTYVSDTQLTTVIPASDIASSGTADVTVVNPAPGGGTSNSQTFTINNPVPTTTSLSPNSEIAGRPAFTLTVNGTNFVSGSVVKWNGTDRLTTYVSDTLLTASIPASDIISVGTAEVTVFNPAPGGGTSNPQTFTINPAPEPTTTSLSPDSKIAGDTGFILTVNGTNFVDGLSEVRWNGEDRNTTYVNSTQLTADIPASDIATAGTVSVTVFNPTPGGGTSNAQTFTINNPVPTTVSISPTSKTAGDAAFTLTVNGTNFVNGSVVKWNGSNRTTTYVSNTQLTAAIPASDIISVGTADVTVVNPAPGGGTSNAQTFTIINPAPSITGISPTSGPIGTQVTVSGATFGSSRDTSYVKFNTTRAADTDYLSWSNTTIKVKVPLSATTGPVTVTTTSGTSNNNKVFTVTATQTDTPDQPNQPDQPDQPGQNPEPLQPGSEKGTPKGGPTWYLAEGSTDWGYACYVTMENPNTTPVTTEVTYMTDKGPVSGGRMILPPRSQLTLNPAGTLGERDFSTRVVCKEGRTIAVDRTMTWTGEKAASPEAHSSIGVTSPSKTWYLPEGSSAWGFECWLLIQNPNSIPAVCEIAYMTENSGAQTRTEVVPPNTRCTYSMEKHIGNKDASIRVSADVPVIPERAMYRNSRREGHDSIGTTSPAKDYYLAEGTTDYDFTTYVLIQNPNNAPNTVSLTYMTPKGPQAKAPFTMEPNSRKTIRVNDVLPNTDLSTRVHGTLPLIAERAMYWDRGQGEACHDSIGMASPHKTFYLPDGQTSEGRETYTLIQNPNSTPVSVEVSYLTPSGKGTKTFTSTIGPNSRQTYDMSKKGIQGRASVTVTSKTASKNIMVERAMYWNSRGAGTDTIGGFSD